MNTEILIQAIEFEKIAKEAVNEAITQQKANGFPVVFSINGQLIYELPNGKITTRKPKILRDFIPPSKA